MLKGKFFILNFSPQLSGFIKFLGPYYMLIITERRKAGSIGGHKVYAVSKSEIISLPDTAEQALMMDSRNEYRYPNNF